MLSSVIWGVLLGFVIIAITLLLGWLVFLSNKNDYEDTIDYMIQTGRTLKTREDVLKFEEWKQNKKEDK